MKLLSDRKLTPQFIELVALTPIEQEQLQHALDAAFERLATLEKEHLNVTRDANDSVTIAVKPYPEAGGAAFDVMLAEIAATLGPERNAALLSLGGDQLEKAAQGRFGTAQRTMTVSKETLASGETCYRINARANNGPNENSNYISDRLRYEELAKQIGPAADLLLPDFAPKR